MRCKDVVRQVDAGLAITWRVRMHLWVCTPCTKYLRFSKYLAESLASFGQPPSEASDLSKKLLSKFTQSL
jgi:hypothetical protein